LRCRSRRWRWRRRRRRREKGEGEEVAKEKRQRASLAYIPWCYRRRTNMVVCRWLFFIFFIKI
jgi:hypothetical protein